MSILVDTAQRHIESLVEKLTGDEDFVPFMTMNGAHADHIYVALMMSDKADMADAITAMCMVYRATEVVFASVAWVVECPDDKVQTVLPPSLDPERVEMVYAVHLDADGASTMHSAPVKRENGEVSIGRWSSSKGGLGGHLGDAVALGMALGRDLSPELAECIDAELADGKDNEVVRAAASVLRERRINSSALKN